ncbi:thiamin pyrophosphokinase-related protein [Aspergillus bombycis]|uniref:Thiamin pyrophosphokinase-related protein n=1 Tax=Aspergillus bombycis TaxID=109264 RepID=A0A1F7ZS56_9EURO|nr:thiamin pyrophosphokinase-related protein [Aspergillus bombycis]OGM42099.1 thiamin pyrophosphokinase-related protein [Aspergillus bombycis]
MHCPSCFAINFTLDVVAYTMAKSNLELVDECDKFPYYEDNPAFYAAHLKKHHAFRVNGCDAVLGYILNSAVAKFHWPAEYWTVDSTNQTVTLNTAPDATPEQRSKVMDETLRAEAKRGNFEVLKGWRNEMYAVYAPGGKFLLEMERCATPLFGVVSYGVHATCYVEDEHGLQFWVPKRAKTKQTYPGMLDNSVAGGMSTNERPFECLVREAEEEASLPEDVTRAAAKSVGCVSYFYVRDSRAGGEVDLLQPEVDDGEVEEFKLYTVEETKKALANGEFKPNCAVVFIDFFIRHGILTPENEPDYFQILTRMHRRFEFPTASHFAH